MKKILLLTFISLFVVPLSLVFSQACSGDIFGDQNASNQCAKTTQEQAKAKGYNANCSVEISTSPSGQTLYSPVCNINGVDGFGANLLSGWNTASGTPAVNSGWNILNTELNRISTFGVTTGYNGTSSSPLLSTTTNPLARSTRAIEARIDAIRQQIFSGTRKMYQDQLNEYVQINPGIKSTVDSILSKTYSGDGIGSLTFKPDQPKTSSQTPSSSGGSNSCPTFSRNLKLGDSGKDVLALGDVLYSEGLYSGNDSNTFNSEVEEAVRDYQVKYRADILDRASLKDPTGIVGALTREHLNNRCKTGVVNNADDPITNTPVSVDPNNMSFRFIKIATVENGWVSWREVELYEKKVVNVSATSSVSTANCYVLPNGTSNCNNLGSTTSTTTVESKINILPSRINAPSFTFPGANLSEVSAGKAVDGNIETAWNAGETNVPCRTPGTLGCPSAVREANFIIDLGKIKNISRIRLIENGDTITEVTTVYVSNNGKDYTELTKFVGPIADRQNLDFPKKINPNAPSPKIAGAVVSKGLPTADNPNILSIMNTAKTELYNMAIGLPASTTGTATLRLKVSSYGYSPAGNFQYVWRVENADYIRLEKSIENDPSLGVLDAQESGGSCTINRDLRDASMFPTSDSTISSLNMSPLILFGYRFINPSVVYAPISEYANLCNVGKRYITKMTAYKSDSNKIAEFKFIIEVSR
jgi:hypothetical protein